MFPIQSRRPYGHAGAVRSQKPIKSGNKKKSDIFFDPEGVVAAPGAKGNLPATFADFDVHMDDRESIKEQIDPKPQGATKEDVRRVYLNPRRPSSKKAGARALAGISGDALYPTAGSLTAYFTAGKPGAPDKSLKGATVGKPFVSKTFTPAITTDSTPSGGGIFRVPDVSEKRSIKAGINLKMTKENFQIQTPAPSDENKTVSGADGKDTERDEYDEEFKENEPPRVFLRGVDPKKDKRFGADSPFGCDLPHLITPYAQGPIRASDPASKLPDTISLKGAMVISKGKEIEPVPLIREGALGELSADHLHRTETRGLVYIPSTGLQDRNDSSKHFAPTLTMASGLREMKTALSKFDAFKIWEDGEDGSDDMEGKKCYDDEGEGDDEGQLEEDEYEALLKLHFGDGWTEKVVENPSSDTILVRYQASKNVRTSYNRTTETRNLVDDGTGSFPPPAKLRIIHKSPRAARDASENRIDISAAKTAGGDDVVVLESFGDANGENAAPPMDTDPLVISCGNENEIPPDFTSIPRHENHMPAVSLMNKVEKFPCKPSLLSSENLPSVPTGSWTVASPELQSLAVHSPHKPDLLYTTATTAAAIMNNPLTPNFPASLRRLNSFRQFRDPLATVPIQLPQHHGRKHPSIPNDTDDDDRCGSRSGAHILLEPDRTGGYDNEDMLSQLNLICLQASLPHIPYNSN